MSDLNHVKLSRILHNTLSAAFLLLLAALILFTSSVPAGADPRLLSAVSRTASASGAAASKTDPTMAKKLEGFWSGVLPTRVSRIGSTGQYVLDDTTFRFDSDAEQPLLVATDSMDGVYLAPDKWSVSNGEVSFTLYASSRESVAKLHFEGDALVGTYTQSGYMREIRFTRTQTPAGSIPTQLSFEGRTGSQWRQLLKQYGTYTSGSSISFTYDLQNTQTSNIYTTYGLDQLMSTMRSYRDVDRMKAVLDLVCYYFRHDGNVAVSSSGISPQAAINMCLQNGAIECRGLSTILAEMLRLCNIPAKVVVCQPAIEPSTDCHVLVQAYSYDLGQWVMLDPTYHLMLQTKDGKYIDLRRLRTALINGETLVANDDAGHNGMPFSMTYYRDYMSKNTFRFSCSARSNFNSAWDGGITYMLVPDGWTVPNRWGRSETLTTSADAFFAAPPARSGHPNTSAATGLNSDDCFVLGKYRYVNAQNVLWVNARSLDPDSCLGKIRSTGIKSDSMKDGDARSIPVGTNVYSCVGCADIALVKRGDTYVPYLRQKN